jgi:hypothetical protein
LILVTLLPKKALFLNLHGFVATEPLIIDNIFGLAWRFLLKTALPPVLVLYTKDQ